MKDCKRISGFKPFFNVKYEDIKIGSCIFNNRIFSVLDITDNSPLPFIAKMELEIKSENFQMKTKKDIESEVHIQSYVGLHGIAPKIYDFFSCKYRGKEYYTILMEKIEGYTLDEFIKKNGNISSELKKRIKKSLDRLYDLGIRHDDMHGGNFIITKNGVYIIDFGDTKLYKNKVPQIERIYTINVDNGNLVVGKEDPMVEKIKKERLEKMKKIVNNARKVGIKNEISNLKQMIEKYKKKGNVTMVKVYEKIIKQKEEQFKRL